MASQGALTKNWFDMDTAEFIGEYTVDVQNITKPSIVYTNRQYYYPNNFTTTVSVDGVELTGEQVLISSSDLYQEILVIDGSFTGKTVQVSIRANNAFIQ